jgi:LPXTG-site transpeptidase (sortase) family protein
MRRGPFILLGAGILVLLASIPAAGLGRTPDHLVATSRNVLVRITPTPSPSAPPTATPTAQPPEPAQANGAAIAAPAAPPTPVIARITIPRIGIRNAPVYDRGVDLKGFMLIAPGYAVTRYAYSAPFGRGNTFIYGHDDIQGNIFGHLYDLAPGDIVQVIVGGETQVYRVTGHQIVPPSDVSVLGPTQDVRLTIMTCWPFNVDTKRWIVTAVKA